jgi:hypothetical protein
MKFIVGPMWFGKTNSIGYRLGSVNRLIFMSPSQRRSNGGFHLKFGW